MADSNTTTSTSAVRCTIVTPERAFLDQTVEYVILPMFDGELGVYPGRQSLVGRLGPGELRLNSSTGTTTFFIDGGFAQVKENLVTVLTAKATPVEKLDGKAAAEALTKAEAMPTSNAVEIDNRNKAIARAQAQVRIVQKLQK